MTVPPWPIVPIFQSTLPGWGATHRRRRDPPAVHISIHAPRMGSDPATPPRSASRPRFQSTLPGWGATLSVVSRRRPHGISIHAPRMGSDNPFCPVAENGVYFNPRSPDGERPCHVWRWHDHAGISIHAPRMGSDAGGLKPCRHGRHISIHAPRMGSDVERDNGVLLRYLISIHAPRMGSDLTSITPCGATNQFQSTLPGWGATTSSRACASGRPYFNPRSPDGERHAFWTPERVTVCISIHVPRMGSDQVHFCRIIARGEFQSTFPGWGATHRPTGSRRMRCYFNPRSPDGERPCWTTTGSAIIHFNPRSPDGERQSAMALSALPSLFQSTFPGWGATADAAGAEPPSSISIHVPRMGSDSIETGRMQHIQCYFNPRSPDGERPYRPNPPHDPCLFQSTFPGWGATTPTPT